MSTKERKSRYSSLKQDLDSDIFNGKWHTVDTTLKRPTSAPHYNVVDLFAGAGGMSLGYRHAGYHELFNCEIDEDASATLRRNFPESINFHRPIEELTDEEILAATEGKEVHVVTGGPPCQGFSVAGFRDPNDPRNKLFYQFVRVVRLLKPWYVLMENVPGILTIKDGKVKRAIIEEFKDAGYPDMSVRIIEAATLGVPQLRTRAIFVGNRFGMENPYPREILSQDKYVPIEAAISDLENAPRNPATNHEWTQHSAKFEARISAVPPGGSLYETFRDAFKRQYLGVPSMTIKENHGGTHIHPRLNRVISAREMARLQTFPDSFIFEGTMKRAMWQVGNAVPVLMARHLSAALLPSLDKIRAEMPKPTGTKRVKAAV